ncbi:MAG: FAD-dependent monooxygenase [Micropepsaceae bacterium]
MPDRILIAGAGIGGLAAALALADGGGHVTVFEAHDGPGESGAGLQLSANAVKALRALGLEQAVAARASRPEAVELRLPGSGRLVSRVALGARHEARFGAPYFHIHRADLHAVLAEAAEAHPAIQVMTGARVARVTHGKSQVGVELDGGAETSGDVLIGADGIHSVVREGVAGKDEPVFTGMMAWRACVPLRDGEEVAPVASVWMGRGRHLVTYPLRQRGVMNLVGVVERKDWTEESWTSEGTAEGMRADFGGWHRSVDDMLARLETPWRWALFERHPLSVWSAGRVALLGDACHAMPPFLAQGAAMALEDAVVLARCLKMRGDDVSHALRDYGAARQERTAKMQAASWANAWRFHLESGWLRTVVYGALGIASRIAPGQPGKMFDWVYAYDPV